ncbi:hypothetical protein A2Y85_05065 [candidate division WOR-3 bacterium RBG_13_43_14]|uniref:OmpH family outer membrane protein n=1 Tax=candidate division WOR-3 bacterium RBG_13_43_14 TaxID=1802590 RepID=A0A1F4U8H1_UNCW3|nr:MAG: hypothetical protein A2Y85_05065 [candidate division WOR-3 bacterium RBG_13_43_14]
MFRYTAFFIVLASLFASAKETKIGFIDSESIFREYHATATVTNQFNEFINTYRDSAATLKRNIEQIQRDFEAQKLVLSEEARLRKLDEIETLQANYNKFLDEIFGSNGKIEQKNDELMTPLLKKINDAVQKIAELEDFKMVVDLTADVFYASDELNLTTLVINELNLEYGPQTTPGTEKNKVIAIMPLREENKEASDASLSERCHIELYRAIEPFKQKYEVIARNEVNSEIVRNNFGKDMDENQALQVGRRLICDYIIIGRVSKYANKIEYTISLREVSSGQEIIKMTNTITEEIKLSESLSNDLRSVIEKIQK